jgi:hypothetical protein
MKILSVTKLVMLTFVISMISCSEYNEIDDKISIKEENRLKSDEIKEQFMLESEEPLDIIKNSKLFNKTIDLFSKTENSELLRGVDFDISSISVAKYVNQETRAILINQTNDLNSNVSYSFVTYGLDDKVFFDYLIVRIERLEADVYLTQFFSSDDEFIGEMIVKDSLVISTRVNELNSKISWNQCVKRAINRMSSGTTEGNVEALLCFAFGPSCAAGTALGCLGVSLFS